MTFDSTPTSSSLIARVKGILLKPKLEWPIIDAEPATVKGLFTGYAMILAAIGPVAGFIGGQLFPISVMGNTFRMPLVGGLVSAIVSYVLSLVGVYLVGLIIDALAPTFGGQKDKVRAMKVAVYSWTAAWVAGIFGLVPMLGILAILGLYSFYLLYLGLPVLMRAPQDKALGYTAVAALCGIGVFIVIGVIASAITAPFIASAMQPVVVYP